METSYRDIRDQLNNGRRVLFIGTSCQVWGLKCFLGKTYENLLTVDLICHGVPPETYLREYLAYQEKRLGKKIDAVTFRGDTKENDFHIWLWSKGIPLYGRFAREDLFFAGFVNFMIFEEKCYSCPFASAYRVADLSIGDWGGPTNLKGQKLSLVFVNTAAAQNWVEELRNESDSEWEPHTVEQAVQSNEQLQGPSTKPKEYEQMREAYRESGYISMAQQYIAPYIRRYRQKKRREKQRWVIGLPLRALRKIKRKVFNS